MIFLRSFHVTLASPILALTASPLPPILLRVTPRYLNLLTYFNYIGASPINNVHFSTVLCVAITSVLPVLTFSRGLAVLKKSYLNFEFLMPRNGLKIGKVLRT